MWGVRRMHREASHVGEAPERGLAASRGVEAVRRATCRCPSSGNTEKIQGAERP